MFWPSSRGGWIKHLKIFRKVFGEWIIFLKIIPEDILTKQQWFQLNINQSDTVNCNQKIVLENTVYCKNSSWKYSVL